MQIKKLYNHLLGKTSSLKPAKITWNNIKGYIQFLYRKSIGGFNVQDHVYEQIIWRRTEVQRNSPICWYTGNCKVCGCDIYGKTMEDRPCSISEHPDLLAKRNPCYPGMMDKKTWNEFKKINKIKLFQ